MFTVHSKQGDRVGRLLSTIEVGQDEPDPAWVGVAGANATRRTQGRRASACACAPLGEVRPVLEDGNRFGVPSFCRLCAKTETDAPERQASIR